MCVGAWRAMTTWDDSNSPPPKPAGRPDLAFPGRVAWSDEQLMRLENEWRRLQRAFAYHPHVRVVPLQGDPPEQYQIEYRLRSLSMGKSGQLEYVTSCAVHIWLAPRFPQEPPLVRPVGTAFHPNIVAEGVKIDRAWTSSTSTLADVVSSVGRMLAYQEYDPEVVWNDTAMEWIVANPDYVPVDAEADLSPDAGGDALERICKFGPRTLEQIRGQLKQMCDSLLATEGAPNVREIQAACVRMRQAVSPFLENDVPDELRAAAAELDDWARQMPITFPTWEVVRRYRLAVESALALTQQLREFERAILYEMEAVDALVQSPPPESLDELLRAIPPLPKLQMLHANLNNLMKRAELALLEVGNTVRRMSALPPMTVKRCSGLVLKRLEADGGRAATLAAESSEKVQAAYSRLVPILGRAKVHAPALKRISDWREYTDFIDRAADFVKQITDWGPTGLQAYYLNNESGQFGPFELEQRVTLGSQNLAVRNPASTIIEIIDADSGAVLKRAETGSIVLNIADPASGTRFPTTFHLTGNCDEMAIQFDYLIRESMITLAALGPKLRAPDGWLGAFNEALTARHPKIREDHERLQKLWQTLRDDLASLRPFKERLATLRMLQRISESAARIAQRLADAQQNLTAATQRIGTIVAGCNTDMETGRLHIPQKWAKEYPDQLQRHDQAGQDIADLTQQAELLVRDVQQRVNSPELRGKGDLPVLLFMPNFPQAWVDLATEFSDLAIARRLSELARLLNIKIVGDNWPAPGSILIVEKAPVEPAANADELNVAMDDALASFGSEPKGEYAEDSDNEIGRDKAEGEI